MDTVSMAEPYGIEHNVRSGSRASAKASELRADLDLQHFRRRAQGRPHTKAGQVRQVWPEIRNALVAGHRLKDIRTWLSEMGIDIGYARLSDYVSQLKRREAVLAPPRTNSEAPRLTRRKEREPASNQKATGAIGADPLANLLEHERREVLFDFNPEPNARKLIGFKEE